MGANQAFENTEDRVRISKPGGRQPDRPLSLALHIQQRPCTTLQADRRNARTHSVKQISQIAASIKQFGFNNPILVDADNIVIAGHGRLAAAKQLGMTEVPTILLDHLSPAERRAYVMADNRLAELAGWDDALLAVELQYLTQIDIDFSVELTGFATVDVDRILFSAAPPDPAEQEDEAPLSVNGPAITRPGDLWLLGPHRLLCGNALDPVSFQILMAGKSAQMVFTDPPYNVKIQGHVGGSGKVQHREFAMAAGEMSPAEFTNFLTTALTRLAENSANGSIHYICMDWRHMQELLAAGQTAYSELKNLCVWNKDNGGMGGFYRSKHELIFVYKAGRESHINNFGLGQDGRYRTNVWDYPGVNSLHPSRMNDLTMHPTVKPIALVADAIQDCSKRNGIVLDSFCGSGTTLMAAEKTGRIGYGLELDALYVDTIIRRWQAMTGQDVCHADTGRRFCELEKNASCVPPPKTTAVTDPPQDRALISAPRDA